MKQKNKIEPIILKLFIWLFIMSVSVSVIPSNTIGVFGFFGETIAEVVQTETIEIVKESRKLTAVAMQVEQKQSYQQIQGFELLNSDTTRIMPFVLICIMIFIAYSYKLPNAWNLISYKVRLDD